MDEIIARLQALHTQMQRRPRAYPRHCMELGAILTDLRAFRHEAGELVKEIDPDSGEISYHAHIDHSDKLALNPGSATGVGRKYTEK
jgi:hypothetical protein